MFYFKEIAFDYERECSRLDAPKENMQEWLNNNALEVIRFKTGRICEINKSWLSKTEDGRKLYIVQVKIF